MKLLMYSICDKATSYIFPYQAFNDQDAIRTFSTNINNNIMSKDHAEDFELFCVGEFDLETGLVKSYTPNVHVTSGLSVLRKDNE